MKLPGRGVLSLGRCLHGASLDLARGGFSQTLRASLCVARGQGTAIHLARLAVHGFSGPGGGTAKNPASFTHWLSELAQGQDWKCLRDASGQVGRLGETRLNQMSWSHERTNVSAERDNPPIGGRIRAARPQNEKPCVITTLPESYRKRHVFRRLSDTIWEEKPPSFSDKKHDNSRPIPASSPLCRNGRSLAMVPRRNAA